MKQAFAVIHQPPIGAFRLGLADLPPVILYLAVKNLHQRMYLVPEAVIAVIDSLGCQKRVMV